MRGRGAFSASADPSSLAEPAGRGRPPFLRYRRNRLSRLTIRGASGERRAARGEGVGQGVGGRAEEYRGPATDYM
jgi:hypothetical protein